MSIGIDLLAAAVLPALVFVFYVVRRDAFPEPLSVVATTFVPGVLTIVPLFAFFRLVGGVLSDFDDPLHVALAAAFLEVAIPEEVIKFLVLYFYAFRHDAFDEPMDGIVYGVAASLGFATLENVLYIADGGWNTAAIRALTAVPSHALNGAIMGFYVGLAHALPGRRIGFLVTAVAVPVLLHGLYDLPLMMSGDATMTIAVIVVQIVIARRLYRRLKLMQTRQVARRVAE